MRQTLKIPVTGSGETSARSRAQARGHEIIIDEPVERQGTDFGASPLEVLAASFIGCTNVIASRLADELGIRLEGLAVDVTLHLDAGVLSGTSQGAPFPDVRLAVRGRSDASPAALEDLRQQLARRCPVSALFRHAGAEVEEVWTIETLAASEGAPARAH